MTLAELIRLMESKKRVMLNEAREKASYDYKLADLIGRSVARIYSSSNRLPDISQIYPNLFDSEEIEELKQENKDKASALRFKQFASSFNKNYKREVSKSNE